MSSPIFELNKILKSEVQEIISARDKGLAMHHTNDFDAAGDEIEKVVRNIIKRKLPIDYYVGHGHIVDEKLNYNGQHDIVIADNCGSPILFSSENGTEYFPYESIYAIGEIKSSYYTSKKYIEKYIEKIKQLYSNLQRIDTPTNQLTKDFSLSVDPNISFKSSDSRPYKNPLLKFMFFVDNGEFQESHIADLYKSTEDKYLPNFICILNKGIIIKATNNGSLAMELFPEFIKVDEQSQYNWVFIEFGKNTDSYAGQLAFLYFAINTHLRSCLVQRPNLFNYFNGFFQSNQWHIINS